MPCRGRVGSNRGHEATYTELSYVSRVWGQVRFRRGPRKCSYFNALAESGDAESSRSIPWISVEHVPTFFTAFLLKGLRKNEAKAPCCQRSLSSLVRPQRRCGTRQLCTRFAPSFPPFTSGELVPGEDMHLLDYWRRQALTCWPHAAPWSGFWRFWSMLGRAMLARRPPPDRLPSVSLPPWACTMECAMASPRPTPPVSQLRDSSSL